MVLRYLELIYRSSYKEFGGPEKTLNTLSNA